jgi:hypothetical protein
VSAIDVERVSNGPHAIETGMFCKGFSGPWVASEVAVMTRVIVPAMLFLLSLCGNQGAVAQEGARDVFFVIPHTHWEGAIFKTRE